jgi:hypothetical protein
VNRILITALALVLLGLQTTSCSEPGSAGTNTNWLRSCTESRECGEYGSCLCGLCTNTCSNDSECSPGICGSSLDASNRCGVHEAARLCVPRPPGGAACTEVPLPPGSELGLAVSTACDLAGALLCEGFDAPVPATYATEYFGPMTAAVQDCMVRQGSGALHFDASAFGWVQTQMRLPAPIASGPLYARFYAYLPSGFSIPDYLVMFELWSQAANSEGKLSVEAISSNALEIQFSDRSAYAASPASLLRDQWMCIELALDVAPSGGTASLSVNGTRVIEATNVVTSPPAPISVAVVEALPSPESTRVELVIDELAIATQPIGCP